MSAQLPTDVTAAIHDATMRAIDSDEASSLCLDDMTDRAILKLLIINATAEAVNQCLNVIKEEL